MTFFDLLFLFPFLATLVALISAAVFSLRGQHARAGRIAAGAGIFLAVYVAIGIGVSLATPRRFVSFGERHCYDDWCVAVLEAHSGPPFTIKIRVSSDAKRVSQAAPGTKVFLEDSTGKRYQGWLVPGQPGFGTRIGPGDAFETAHEFDPPPNVQIAGVVVLHGSSGPGNVILADDNGFFHPPMLYKLN